MQYRRISHLETPVSAVGFGTWPLAGTGRFAGQAIGRGPVDEAEALRAIGTALDSGVNFFDTAPTYGHAEALLGKALAGRGENAVVCTKFGIRLNQAGAAIKDFSAANLQSSVDASLRRLNRDRIDILLMHNPHDDFDWSNYNPRPFEKLQQQGKIRTWGVSSASVYGASRVVRAGFGHVVELIYNALDRRAEDWVFPLARIRGMGVIGRVPLAQGYLAGRFLKEETVFSADDQRSALSAGEREWLRSTCGKLDFLGELPGGMPAAALRFVLGQVAVTTAIPGMRSAEQVLQNIQAADGGTLDTVTLARIRRTVPDVFENWKRKASA